MPDTTTERARALLAAARAVDGRFDYRALVDSTHPRGAVALKDFLTAANPATIAALCERLIRLEEALDEIGRTSRDLRSVWAAGVALVGGEVTHRSDCAVHNEPAYPNGPCDCGALPDPARARP